MSLIPQWIGCMIRPHAYSRFHLPYIDGWYENRYDFKNKLCPFKPWFLNRLTASSNKVSSYCSSGDPESTHRWTVSVSNCEYLREFCMTTVFVDSCLNSHVVSGPNLSRVMENLILRCPYGQPMREVMAVPEELSEVRLEVSDEPEELESEESSLVTGVASLCWRWLRRRLSADLRSIRRSILWFGVPCSWELWSFASDSVTDSNNMNATHGNFILMSIPICLDVGEELRRGGYLPLLFYVRQDYYDGIATIYLFPPRNTSNVFT